MRRIIDSSRVLVAATIPKGREQGKRRETAGQRANAARNTRFPCCTAIFWICWSREVTNPNPKLIHGKFD
jgi:hypothetical protein